MCPLYLHVRPAVGILLTCQAPFIREDSFASFSRYKHHAVKMNEQATHWNLIHDGERSTDLLVGRDFADAKAFGEILLIVRATYLTNPQTNPTHTYSLVVEFRRKVSGRHPVRAMKLACYAMGENE